MSKEVTRINVEQQNDKWVATLGFDDNTGVNQSFDTFHEANDWAASQVVDAKAQEKLEEELNTQTDHANS